jgi:hypothetical protein
MHLVLPPLRGPGQIAHAEGDGVGKPDSSSLCDGLVASAGLSAAGSWSVRSAELMESNQGGNVDRPLHLRDTTPIARDSVRDSVIEA